MHLKNILCLFVKPAEPERTRERQKLYCVQTCDG